MVGLLLAVFMFFAAALSAFGAGLVIFFVLGAFLAATAAFVAPAGSALTLAARHVAAAPLTTATAVLVLFIVTALVTALAAAMPALTATATSAAAVATFLVMLAARDMAGAAAAFRLSGSSLAWFHAMRCRMAGTVNRTAFARCVASPRWIFHGADARPTKCSDRQKDRGQTEKLRCPREIK